MKSVNNMAAVLPFSQIGPVSSWPTARFHTQGMPQGLLHGATRNPVM
jgi:hypothetical protein